MTTVVLRTPGHYERREEPCGESYVWCGECVVVECGCGRRLDLTPSETVCGCGTDHADLIGEETSSRRRSEGDPRPWRDEHPEWQEHREESLRSESQYSQELAAVE
jgi:hypothetical protein